MSNHVCIKQETFDQLLSQALSNCFSHNRTIEKYQTPDIQERKREYVRNLYSKYKGIHHPSLNVIDSYIKSQENNPTWINKFK